jgi:hypothetical protein
MSGSPKPLTPDVSALPSNQLLPVAELLRHLLPLDQNILTPGSLSMKRPSKVVSLPGYKLEISFSDGVAGIIDLSESVGGLSHKKHKSHRSGWRAGVSN